VLKFRIYNISYDTDGEDDIELPKEFVVEFEDHENVEDMLSDYITEQTGFCHGGFLYEVIN
jgi:hypothetical protein